MIATATGEIADTVSKSREPNDRSVVPASALSAGLSCLRGLFRSGIVHAFTLSLVLPVVAGMAVPTAVQAQTVEPPKKPGLTLNAQDGAVLLQVFPDNSNTGNRAATSFQYRYKTDGDYGNWRNLGSISGQASLKSYTVSGLTNGTRYTFQVRAVNTAGEGPPSNEATATPMDADITPPSLTDARFTGSTTLVLTYDEALDETSTPSRDSFALDVAGRPGPFEARTVSVTGSTVELTLDVEMDAGGRATLTYSPELSQSTIRDLGGNHARPFAEIPVLNFPAAPEQRAPGPGNGEVRLNWTPVRDGGSPVTKLQYQQREDSLGSWGETWTDIDASRLGDANGRSHVVSGLANGTAYRFRLRAVNAVGVSPPSDARSATPEAVDTTEPELVDAEVNAATLTLFWNEALDESSNPAASDFEVTGDGTQRTVDAVVVISTTLRLAIDPPAQAEEAFTVSHTPGTTPIQDPAGNAASALSEVAVRNVTGEAAAGVPRVPLMAPASHPHRQGFVRVINRSAQPGEVSIVAFDDAGVEYDPVTLSIDANEVAHFNSTDLEEGNPAKGLEGGTGPGEGEWRLELHSALDIEVLSYVRAHDGFVTSMHELAPRDGSGHRVVFMNPASNRSQVSRLRLINPGEAAAVVRIEGVDDAGEAGDGAVELTLAGGEARTLTSEALESGAGEALTGALGDGTGKWRLRVTADGPIRVMSLLRSPTGHLTNLSAVPGGSGTGVPRVPLMAPASHPHRQGFVRVINRSAQPGEVSIVAFDDAGVEYDPVTLSIDANEVAHFNSTDLEEGNPAKGLEGGTGPGEGEWRLELHSALDIEVLSYVRAHDGFVTSMHELAPRDGSGHRVVFMNPASNRSQVSRLRLINPGEAAAVVRIEGVDDAGEAGDGAVELTLAGGEARTLTSEALESGAGEALTGALGDGTGKWRLRVTADGPIRVMSLLRSPTGHLTNLSAVPPRIP